MILSRWKLICFPIRRKELGLAPWRLSRQRAMRNRRSLLLLAFISSLALSLAQTGGSGPSGLQPDGTPLVSERGRRIRAELLNLPKHAWAGDYYRGDGLGVNVSLLIAPEAGFVFTWDGCLGRYDWNYGNVRVVAGTGTSID